ncbi:hypothetical protein G7068_00560 [Leucobacter viscericola]|uniref:SLH domain-containing protein n=1 Tax=Leucobacter viscericola TaxID=2714935 RepID=A0A6G7XB90_9MICO|nr:InlB B-repeat-containing protein [Leucobacter viscericola]QIK61870.1 hypothetical protein G7068_00560 [Leucobacter viscericola]
MIANNTVFETNHTGDGVSGGGAIRVTGGALEVDHSTFTNNSAAAGSDGGAISSEGSGNVRINDSVFDGNKRVGNQNQYGGAISVKQPGVADSTVEITNSIFTNNFSSASGNLSTGGAIRIFGTPNLKSVLIDNSLFRGNSTKIAVAQSGGAIGFMTTPNSTISNSTFIDNTSTRYGGAVYYENSPDNTIINSTFAGNSSVLGGSGVSAYSSAVAIDSSTFLSNALGVHGTGTQIRVKDSVLPKLANPAVTYSETTLAYAPSLFTVNTSATLEKVSETNFVAPIRTDGAAYKAIEGARTLSQAQNGVDRKTPLSDVGAYETPQTYTVSFESNGGSGVDPIEGVLHGAVVSAPVDPSRDGHTFAGWTLDGASYDFASSPVTADIVLHATWTEVTEPEVVVPQIMPGSLPKGTVGDVYAATITTKGNGVATLSIDGGALPDGLTFDAVSGKIAGKATKTGTFRFTIRADIGGVFATKEFSITIDKKGFVGPCSAPRPVPVFSDAPLTHKFYKEIDWMECMKYATGWRMPAGKPEYRPTWNLERQAMAAFIFRMEAPKNYRAPKVSPFRDMKPSDKFYKEVAWMHEMGYATGWAEPTGKPTFRPHLSLSREAMAAFIYRLEASKNSAVKSYRAPSVSPMTDMKPGMKFYKEISWMWDEGLTTGNRVGGAKEYWPKDDLSRQAMAAFIYRLVTDYRKG